MMKERGEEGRGLRVWPAVKGSKALCPVPSHVRCSKMSIVAEKTRELAKGRV